MAGLLFVFRKRNVLMYYINLVSNKKLKKYIYIKFHYHDDQYSCFCKYLMRVTYDLRNISLKYIGWCNVYDAK